MGAVIQLAPAADVDAAWEEYRAHVAQALEDPSLFVDREWMQRRAMLNRRFDQLYLIGERA